MQRISSSTPPPSRWIQRRNELNSLARNLRALSPRRIIVAGGPRSGKSILASKLSDAYRIPVFAHGPADIERLGWSGVSEDAAGWLLRHGPWICEGVEMPRALRKFLAAHPSRSPADLVVFINEQVTDRVTGQTSMAKGCQTVFDEILPQLIASGAHVITP